MTRVDDITLATNTIKSLLGRASSENKEKDDFIKKFEVYAKSSAGKKAIEESVERHREFSNDEHNLHTSLQNSEENLAEAKKKHNSLLKEYRAADAAGNSARTRALATEIANAQQEEQRADANLVNACNNIDVFYNDNPCELTNIMDDFIPGDEDANRKLRADFMNIVNKGVENRKLSSSAAGGYDNTLQELSDRFKTDSNIVDSFFHVLIDRVSDDENNKNLLFDRWEKWIFNSKSDRKVETIMNNARVELVSMDEHYKELQIAEKSLATAVEADKARIESNIIAINNQLSASIGRLMNDRPDEFGAIMEFISKNGNSSALKSFVEKTNKDIENDPKKNPNSLLGNRGDENPLLNLLTNKINEPLKANALFDEQIPENKEKEAVEGDKFKHSIKRNEIKTIYDKRAAISLGGGEHMKFVEVGFNFLVDKGLDTIGKGWNFMLNEIKNQRSFDNQFDANQAYVQWMEKYGFFDRNSGALNTNTRHPDVDRIMNCKTISSQNAMMNSSDILCDKESNPFYNHNALEKYWRKKLLDYRATLENHKIPAKMVDVENEFGEKEYEYETLKSYPQATNKGKKQFFTKEMKIAPKYIGFPIPEGTDINSDTLTRELEDIIKPKGVEKLSTNEKDALKTIEDKPVLALSGGSPIPKLNSTTGEKIVKQVKIGASYDPEVVKRERKKLQNEAAEFFNIFQGVDLMGLEEKDNPRAWSRIEEAVSGVISFGDNGLEAQEKKNKEISEGEFAEITKQKAIAAARYKSAA